jgi:hypothetical protein
LYCKQYIGNTSVCFPLLSLTVNNYHAIDRLIYVQPSIFIFFVTLRSVFRSWSLSSRSFEITLRHSTLGRILRTSDHTLRPLPVNTQQTHFYALGGIRTPIPASERTQTHALYHPTTEIGFSIIYILYLALRSTKYLLEQHNKAQESKTN